MKGIKLKREEALACVVPLAKEKPYRWQQGALSKMDRALRLKKSALNKVSDKQKIELALRKKIKAELMLQQMKAVGYIFCMTCGERPDWRGISLHHQKFLSRMGETQVDNVKLLCYNCHSIAHGIREVKDD